MTRRSNQLFTRTDGWSACRLSLESLEGRLAPGSALHGTMAHEALVGSAAVSPADPAANSGYTGTPVQPVVLVPVSAANVTSEGTAVAVAGPAPDVARKVGNLVDAGSTVAPLSGTNASLPFRGSAGAGPAASFSAGGGFRPMLGNSGGDASPSTSTNQAPVPGPVVGAVNSTANSSFVSGGGKLAAPSAVPVGTGTAPQTNEDLPGSVTLTPDKPPPQLVGDPITWTAMVTNGGDNPVFQFRVGPAGGSLRVVQDFSTADTFTWVPMQEGAYNVQVIVEDGFGGPETATTVAGDAVNSRVTGGNPVITPTTNPLVALYSAPPSTLPAMHVDFRPADDPNAPWVSTDTKPCLPGLSTNFLVAGMRANTTYAMANVTSRGSSAIQFFTTSSLPANLDFPQFTVRQAPSAGSDVSLGMVFHMVDFMPNPAVNLLATDLAGNIEWYYDSVATNVNYVFANSLVPGGTVLLEGGSSNILDNNLLLETDLAGHTLRETNSDAINAQLTALGKQPIDGFHHDAERLPDGKTAVLAAVHRTIDLDGTPTYYAGDMVLVLDQDFQVAWSWNAFDFLDVHRLPTLAADISPGFVDWLHSNAVSWSPADGNLLVSMRSQDWVIKINYANGAGDGHVIWRLGQDGDFTIHSSDSSPWFSHQHNAHYVDNTTLVVFDNGNTRQASDNSADSRGQALILDEQTRQATLALNVDLGNYSFALGSAQRLPNGDYVFTSGFQHFPVDSFGQSIEVRPDGTQVYVLEVPNHEYRSFRMRGLYGSTDNEADSTTTVTSSVDLSNLGQPVTFTATVTPNSTGSATPTGTATFRDGTNVLGTGTLDVNGVATLTTPALAVGTHSITVTYDGDSNFTSSSSSALNQAVNPLTTVSTVISSTNPSSLGQAVTYTAMITPSAAGPFAAGGTVTFYEGGTAVGNPVPVTAGVATLTAIPAVVGQHSIYAVYSGDGNFIGSTSAMLNQLVILPTTIVSLANTPSISALGQAVTLTATVTPAGGPGNPTGTVTFQEGSVVLGTVTLNGGGVATFATSALGPGAHSFSATYNGDGSFTASTSPSVTQTVNKAVTATTLAAVPNPSVAGQAITFTATISPFAAGSFTAGGTVTFYDGGTPLGSAVPLTGGTAALPTASLAAGSHSITAVYTGDANFMGSTAPAVTQVVNKVATVTTVVSSQNPAAAGQAVSFTATISPFTAGSFTAGGTVTFYDGSTPLGSAVPLAGGTAAFTTSSLAAGTRSITAVYSGDANFTGGSSAVLAQVVNPGSAAVVVSLTNAPSNSAAGQAVTLTATVAAASGSGTPTGTVTFVADGTTPLGASSLVQGTAALTSSILPAGTHTIVASYGGDANFNTGTSSPRTQVVTLAGTTTGLTGSGNVTRPGQSVSFTATITTTGGTGTSLTPSGSVTFYDGTTALGSPVPLMNGHATWTGSSLGTGAHSITAKYNGDANFAASTSPGLAQVVLSSQFFAVGGSNDLVQVRRTSNGALVVQFAPFAAYNQGVTVAMADVNGDGYEDLIVGSAANVGHVKVYDGKALASGTFTAATAESHLITEFMGFDPKYHIGVNVAAGYLDGSTHADIILGAASGNPQVKVLNSSGIGTGGFDAAHPDANLLATWFAYGLGFNIGATVAAGDIEGTGIADVVTGTTTGNPNVKVFSGKAIHDRTFNGAHPDANMLANFFPYATGQGLGVNVAVGDVNGDHFADLITAPTVSSPDVRVYDGRAVANGSLTTSTLAAHQLDQFYAFDPRYGSGVTLAAADFTGTGRASILTGASNSPHYRLVDGLNSRGTLPPSLNGIDTVLSNFSGGLNVGA